MLNPSYLGAGVFVSKGNEDSGFAERLCSLMEEAGLGVREAAKEASVSSSMISSWRTGTHAPTNFIAVQRLAHALGVSLSFLLTGKDDTRPDGPPSLLEVLESKGPIHTGLYRISIESLVPRRQSKNQRGHENDNE